MQVVGKCYNSKGTSLEPNFDLLKLFSFSDLPDEKPRITGIKEKYQIGETLEALCTSWQSHPPANLTWFINEEKVLSIIHVSNGPCTIFSRPGMII